MTIFNYILAGLIIAVPALILEKQNKTYAWYYVFLICLSLVIFYNKQFNKLSNTLLGILPRAGE